MTIQEKYNKYIIGEISKEKLLYEIRRDEALKPFITSLMSFDDSIKSLKNRGVISEAVKKREALTLDEINPYEYKKGLDYELDLCYKAVPNSPNQISEEAFRAAQKKILTNLAKDPNYYTKCYADVKPDRSPDLASDADFGNKSKRSDVVIPVKKGLKDPKNQMKEVGKKPKSNVNDSLGKKEKAKRKNPKKVKVDGKQPGPWKKVKLKEGRLSENIPASNTAVMPFAKVKAGMKATDDSGETFKILATGDYNSLKRYDSSKVFDKFLSSDPSGIDATQLVALIDQDGNTFVRVYGTGGVYVYNNAQQQESSVVVKPNSPEADPVRLKKYLDKGLDIKLDSDMKEQKMSLSKILKEIEGTEFEADIKNKHVPQNETELAEAKALVLPVLTKAMLHKNVDLDKDVKLEKGNIWVRVKLGYGILDKEKLKALSSEGSFQGVNPITNTEISLVFSKN